MSEIITVEHLKKYYREVKAVDDISFTVEKGELFGFLGVNGAGKSTTINMLCTLLKPTEGKALINGMELGKEDEEIKTHIGIVYQNNCLDNLLTVQENLLLRGGLYEKDKDKLRHNLTRVTEILNLADVLKRPFGKLSGGQKRRCEIARALMHTPDILFLDEPTTGLDPATRKNVWETVYTLQKEMGMTVFLTTHYMEEAAVADHIGIMDHGHLVEYGTPFSLKETYAKDKLYLIPKAEQRENIVMELRKNDLEYSVLEERIFVKLGSTLSAMPLLAKVEDRIQGFEVIQGTMDDVFLSVTEQK
ncbi:MAG: ABC transporter ATP-binding protein [Lachnospiraceae bacterium]|nr:ABC transporter ATP-binding protein [Lachnospiraceae bacterium]